MSNIVYITHWLAKEINGDFVSSMIEHVTLDKAKAEEHFMRKQKADNTMNIEGHLCQIMRHIVPAELDREYDG